jgi:hypothetical protein
MSSGSVSDRNFTYSMSLGNFLQGVLVFVLLLLQAWLLFFYTSLALRENILRVNGSDIRPWYILFSPNL